MSAEISIALVEPRHVEQLLADGPPADLTEGPLRRLQFGAEFCETLLPTEAQLAHVIDLVGRHARCAYWDEQFRFGVATSGG